MDALLDNREDSERFSWKFLSILSVMHILALVGIIFFSSKTNILVWIFLHFIFITFGASLGLHRYFSHRSYKINNKYLDFFIHLLATLCFQGGPIYWATTHRVHHKLSEKFGDPHDARRGFLWSHMLWLLYERPNGFSYIKSLKYSSDLRKNKMTSLFERYYLKINLTFLFILFIVCLIANNVGLFFFVGPVRIVSVWHCTWLINSYAHGAKFSSQETKIKNSILLCILVGGDGEHLYHHLKPNVPKHSANLISLDYGYYILRILKELKLIEWGNQHHSSNST